MLPFTPNLSHKPQVAVFFDEQTNTFSYVVSDPATDRCAIIDPVMELEYSSGSLDFVGADRMIAYVHEQGLTLDWIIETHVHADHLSAAPYIQERLGGRLGIGREVLVVQETFGKIFNAGTSFRRDGSQFDVLFDDGQHYQIGSLDAYALFTPGHTPACMTHIIGDAAFVGDTLFMPDAGTARADFPGGDAATLFHSIQRIFALPDEMRVFMCHDYAPNGRAVAYETTVGAQKRENIHVKQGSLLDEYVQMRQARDATLAMPSLILPSLQVNMRAGALPPAEEDGQHFLKIPLNAFRA